MRFRSLRHPPSILRAIAFRLTPDYLIGWLICTPTRSFAHPLEYSHVQVIRSRFVLSSSRKKNKFSFILQHLPYSHPMDICFKYALSLPDLVARLMPLRSNMPKKR